MEGWKRFHHAVSAGAIYVRPPWVAPASGLAGRGHRRGLAFGTGGHATTHQCLLAAGGRARLAAGRRGGQRRAVAGRAAAGVRAGLRLRQRRAGAAGGRGERQAQRTEPALLRGRRLCTGRRAADDRRRGRQHGAEADRRLRERLQRRGARRRRATCCWPVCWRRRPTRRRSAFAGYAEHCRVRRTSGSCCIWNAAHETPAGPVRATAPCPAAGERPDGARVHGVRRLQGQPGRRRAGSAAALAGAGHVGVRRARRRRRGGRA